MKIGDSVLTDKGDEGIIVSEWGRSDRSYDWWVEIRFLHLGKARTIKLPYTESELTLANEKISSQSVDKTTD